MKDEHIDINNDTKLWGYNDRHKAVEEARERIPIGVLEQAEKDQAWAEYIKTESDPSGLDAHTPGAKLDHGKDKASLVLGDFSRALQSVVEVGTAGAIKYSEGGWLHVENGAKRYADAGMRHYLSRESGEERDSDSGSLHLAHQAWNILAELELQLKGD